MLETPLLILLVVALAIGWLLGRASANKRRRLAVDSLPTSYMQSLSLLINEQPDEAIDTFIKAFDVTEATFDTHIALGNVSRKRGELEQAIKIHQNLLSRPNLNRKHHDVAHFELAKDYLQAGLFDRAEILLTDLLEKNTALQRQAQLLLINLYESESEWEQALAVALSLLPKRLLRQRSADEQKMAIRVSHFYCELAEQALRDKQYSHASGFVDKALQHDKQSLRATYVKAQLATDVGDTASLVKLLPHLLRRNSKLLYEALWVVDKATQTWSPRRIADYIETLYRDTGSAAVLAQLLTYVPADTAAALVAQHVRHKPSLNALAIWFEYAEGLADLDTQQRELVTEALTQLQANTKRYQCTSCGFKAMHFFWHCPTCKEWDTLEIIRGDNSE